ncbi:hypothetical protein RFI_06237 [Reticulomyxa filosa]|uniref:DNA alkylation repair enzyme n=1 Tax=Reticulomyxa filosa TaxID=46433 RepID=X6P043_RETFI|nr:hypothetical protein RFI_06237 [Reticulomyxa filosa]|eukprot:ETO30882.1 hypothetical protein RFI_06237 [Reticulomyxa filosa]
MELQQPNKKNVCSRNNKNLSTIQNNSCSACVCTHMFIYQKDLKNKVECHGLKAPKIKSLFSEYWKEEWKDLDYPTQYELAICCLRDPYMESQHIGMLLLEKTNGHSDDWKLISTDLKAVLTENCATWATCDGISKVLRLLIKRHGKECASTIKAWKSEDRHIWVQRASCVSFVCIAKHGDFEYRYIMFFFFIWLKMAKRYNDVIMEIASECINNNERFVQLGVGWVLRELSLVDRNRVVAFIKENYAKFSREGLRYAIEKMPGNIRKELMDYEKPTKTKSRKRNLKTATATDV